MRSFVPSGLRMTERKVNKIITYSFCEPFIDRLADYLEENYIKKGKDLGRVAIVFGGKRPSLFTKRELARRIKKSFYPPRFFTIDEFVGYTIQKKEAFSAPQDLDSCYFLYQLISKVTPDLLKGRNTFAQFLPWTREMLSFIDQLDLEMIDDDVLKNIQINAQIGYAVPTDINQMLQSIIKLRNIYHDELKEKKVYTRGFQYLRAAQVIDQVDFKEFDDILFCNFFYFHRTEEAIVKKLYDQGQATLIFQGDQRKWPIFTRIAKNFSCTIEEGKTVDIPQFDLKLYQGGDVHAQVCHVREILKTIKHLDRTVIVLPNPDHIIPLLSEITAIAKDFNISMGYPLKRSSLYSLFEFVFKTQLSRRQHEYYAKDYLKVLRHPFVKNLSLAESPTITRTLIHKIEEILTGKEPSALSGQLFFELEDMESLDELFMLTLESLDRLGIKSNRDQLLLILEEIHNLFFLEWEKINNFAVFAVVLENFLDVLIEKSFLKNYPLNLNIATKMYAIKDELAQTSFKEEHFSAEEIFRIFDGKISREMVAFVGSPLRGLQVLGLFETRSLNFENVIVLDVNEGTLPNLRIYEPLIPREVMISLSLDRLELEEEIQRYQFMRLISSAKNVHLVYQQSKDKERSRFVEELVWEKQKELKTLDVLPIEQASFAVHVSSQKISVKKTKEMTEYLRQIKYSATSINTYLRNPLEFYYKYVLGLKEEEDLLDEPEARQVGTFVHELLEAAFTPFLKRKPEINAHFRERFARMFEERFTNTFGRSMKSDSFLLKSVLVERLNRFLDNEQFNEDRAVEEILYLENHFEDVVPLSCGDIKFRYIVDRVDRLKDGTIAIIDYKTGSINQMPKDISRILSTSSSRESIRDNVRSFQIPLYFYYLDKQYTNQPINAVLYNLRTLELHRFIDDKMTYSREQINNGFLKALDFIITEIINPDVPFVEDQPPY